MYLWQVYANNIYIWLSILVGVSLDNTKYNSVITKIKGYNIIRLYYICKRVLLRKNTINM